MRHAEVAELVKIAFDDFEQEPTKTTHEVWEREFLSASFEHVRTGLYKLLANYEGRKPPSPGAVKAVLATQNASKNHIDLPDEEYQDELSRQESRGFVPVFFQPTESCPVFSYVWKPITDVRDTGRKVKVWGTVVREWKQHYV